MSLFGWVAMGLLAGALARSVAGSPRRGCLFTIAVGVAGALIGGAVAQAAGQQGVNEFSWWSLLVSFSGATVLLIVLSAVDRGS